MKKILVVLAVVAFGFSSTSCDKKCKCTFNLPVVGEVTLEDIDPGDQKCKDLTKIEYNGLSYDASAIGLSCK